tara:strand:- start:610 stop:822 length:213 start_codon:yes stop_codon:yes gene_type:complete
MFELVLSVIAGALSVSIAWLIAIMKRDQEQVVQKIESIKRIAETEKTIEAIEDLAKTEGLEQALADELNR